MYLLCYRNSKQNISESDVNVRCNNHQFLATISCQQCCYCISPNIAEESYELVFQTSLDIFPVCCAYNVCIINCYPYISQKTEKCECVRTETVLFYIKCRYSSEPCHLDQYTVFQVWTISLYQTSEQLFLLFPPISIPPFSFP